MKITITNIPTISKGYKDCGNAPQRLDPHQ